MTSSTHFSLASRSLKLDNAEDIKPHLSPLDPPESQKPTAISLNGNTLGVPACAALADVLRTQKQLETINLADIFTSRLLSEIPPALSSLLTACLDLPRLQSVDLSDNAFGLNTVEPLVHFLERHVPLRHLTLQNNGLGPAAGTKVADALTTLAKKKEEARKSQGTKDGEGNAEIPPLETIICGRNRLESGSMAAWARATTAHAHGLKTVKMVQNGIRQDGIKLLLEAGLVNCEGLQVLDLQDNTFTITGATALSGVVGKLKDLKELGVGDCLLGARGGVLLAKELGKGDVGGNLEVLRAQYNEIDAKGVQQLFVAADKGGLTKLRRVELNGNVFSEDDPGIEGLRELLETRKQEAGGEDGDDDDAEWGIDDLSDLEEPESGEEDEDEEDEEMKEEEDEEHAKRETIVKDADQAENSNVSQKKDVDVDDLADQLKGAQITSS